jgi:hypothetical protein
MRTRNILLGLISIAVAVILTAPLLAQETAGTFSSSSAPRSADAAIELLKKGTNDSSMTVCGRRGAIRNGGRSCSGDSGPSRSC